MNAGIFVSLCAMMLAMPPVFAADQADEHAMHHDAAKASAVAAVSGEANQDTAATQQMPEKMQRMQELMAKLQSSKDPIERRKLLDQHYQLMQEQMDAMHEMSGMGMERVNAQGKTMEKGTTGMGMMKNHQMMAKRMDMMQMMMEQMLQHDAAEHSGAGRK